MYEAIKRLLRGRHNSIRYKYWVLPREWLTYLFRYRLLGKSWVDFYARRLDGFATDTEKRPLENYLKVGRIHLDYLKNQGLKPEHEVLDYGCGVMRFGAYAGKYLEPRNYTGIDISRNRLQKARRVMRDAGVPETSYEAICVTGCELEELDGQAFDFIWAVSVLTHMPEPDIRTMLRAMKPKLKEDARYFFTFSPADQRMRKNIKDFWYPIDDMREICESEGYVFEIMDDWIGMGDTMAKLTVSAA